MDRNQVIGLVLISGILIAYLQFFAPDPQENIAADDTEMVVEKSDEDSNVTAAVEPELVAEQVSDSVQQIQSQSQFGIFAPFANQKERLITVENNTSVFTFSTKGGVLKRLELKNYETYSGNPLILFDENSHREKLMVKTKNGKEVDLNVLNFSSSNSDVKINEEGDSKSISFEVNLNGNQSIVKEYLISADKFEIDYKLHFDGMESSIDKDNVILSIVDQGMHYEKDLKQSRYRSMITYMNGEEDFDDFGERSLDAENETIENVKFFSFKQKFFNKTLIVKNGLINAELAMSVPDNDIITKEFSAKITLPYDMLNNGGNNMLLYYGPNKYDVLNKVGYGLEKNVYLGWSLFRVINEYLILPLFNFLSSSMANIGLVIFLLVLIIKTAIFPFTFKSYKGFAKMRVLKPELDALKEKFGDDQTKFQQEQMKVYQKFGVSPLSGCVPMLFQMPFLFALFQLFPNSIELRGRSFLWAEDLSAYDSFFAWTTEIPLLGNHISLFTLMMSLSTIVYTYISQQMTPTASAPGQPNMKMMSYMMPVIFFFVLNDYASGLTYYYFLSNIITIGQQLISKKFINEEKILAKMHEYSEKSTGKKKSSFSKRLEEAMKAQQEKQKGKK